MKKYSLIILLALCFTTVASATGVGKYVGGDISQLPAYEASNTRYNDINGTRIPDLVTWLVTECGWNTFRVRIFVDPKEKNQSGSTDYAVCQDLNYVLALGKRIKDAGAYFMLDFHYSDTWVDAAHIQAPEAWKNCTTAEKADSVGVYTARVLDALVAGGATPDFVQVGNEIMYGVCGVQVHPYQVNGDDWTGYTDILKAGCNAVRAHCPNAQIILHTDRPCDYEFNRFWYKAVERFGVDYDVIGLSYYPFWHGYLSHAAAVAAGKNSRTDLQSSLDSLAANFPDKTVQIVECAYNFQYSFDGPKYDMSTLWPISESGQYEFVSDLIDFLSAYPQVEGFSYWFPEEAGNGDAATWNPDRNIALGGWLNRGLWSSKNSGGHAINKKSKTEYVQLRMRDFLSAEAQGIPAHSSQTQPTATKRLIHGTIAIDRAGTTYSILGHTL